jgi:hypothetical protein
MLIDQDHVEAEASCINVSDKTSIFSYTDQEGTMAHGIQVNK